MNAHGIRSFVPRPSRTRALTALAAVGLALAVAGPAAAEPNKPPEKKGCSVQLQGPGAGQSIVYPDGYKFSVSAQDRKTHTYTCNDGKWTETVSLTAGGGAKWQNVAILATAGTLQAVKLG
jgi:hypothetical protein